jgi:5-methyltetrahydrofolate--homocysteine methyltransferase
MNYLLVDAIADMREQEALAAVQELLVSGTDPMTVLALCRDAMTIVGERFESGEYFLPELVLAGEMLSQIADIVKPRIQSDATTESLQSPKVLLGTVQGDLHDIGKNIVGFMLDVNGIDVHDLGVDVPVERFVEAIEKEKPDVVGLSGFLTVAFEAMKETVEAIEKAGLRNQVKIMIGGGMVDEHIRAYTGADAYGRDAMAAVSLVEKWSGKD